MEKQRSRAVLETNGCHHKKLDLSKQVKV
ncbi:hypothetical protein Golob_000640, partial [Gossypium lobatum]|nr:hypothetical protein [Gossypium lobatum]